MNKLLLDYCDVVCMNAFTSSLHRLDTAYPGTLPFITGARPLTHHWSLYWPPLSSPRNTHWYLISIRQLFYFALLLCVLSFPPPACNLGQPTAGLEAVWLGYLCGVDWKAGESHCRSLQMQPVLFNFRSLCFANVPHCTGCLCVCMSYVLFDCNFLKLPPSSRLPKTGPACK